MFEEYYIVHKSILPDYFDLVVKARHLTDSGMSVSQAVKEVGISRSTFYKYKDYILESTSITSGRKAVISMILNHENGILSHVLSLISKAGASVLTIDQSIPIHSKASVTITLDVNNMPISMNTLINTLSSINGVDNPRLLALE